MGKYLQHQQDEMETRCVNIKKKLEFMLIFYAFDSMLIRFADAEFVSLFSALLGSMHNFMSDSSGFSFPAQMDIKM